MTKSYWNWRIAVVVAFSGMTWGLLLRYSGWLGLAVVLAAGLAYLATLMWQERRQQGREQATKLLRRATYDDNDWRQQ